MASYKCGFVFINIALGNFAISMHLQNTMKRRLHAALNRTCQIRIIFAILINGFDIY